MQEEAQYGTWIRPKKLVIFWFLTGLFLFLTGLCALSLWFLVSSLPGLVFLYIAVIVSLTRHRFSRRGGGYQAKIHELILSYKKGPGETLDIGCGSGHLIIASAKMDKTSQHLGLDYWGEKWEYSRRQCEINARLEEVDNVRFVNASAAHTGIESGRYEYLFSCLTFHEVRDEADKTLVVKEALRIVKPGGTYVFLDLFDDKNFYPNVEALATSIRQSGCTVETNKTLSELMRLPYPLNGKKALRYARMISGTKSAY